MIVQNDLRLAPIEFDLARDADVLSLERLGLTELRTVTAKDHRGENLIGIRLAEIEECRLRVSALGIVRRRYDAANGLDPTNVRRSFLRRQISSLCRA